MAYMYIIKLIYIDAVMKISYKKKQQLIIGNSVIGVSTSKVKVD